MRQRADDQPVQSQVEQFSDGRLAADAAAQFAIDPDRLDDGADAGEVFHLPMAGAVQIDQVEALGPQGDPVTCHGGRVLAEDGFPLVVALLEADAFAPPQVNGRPDFHACSRSCLNARQRVETRNMTRPRASCKAGDIRSPPVATGGMVDRATAVPAVP